MSIYFLSQITTNMLVKVIIIVFVIVYEITMQYILSLGKAKWQKCGVGPILTAVLYFFLYSIYVFIYALPSALGFFVAEIALQEEVAAVVAKGDSFIEEQMVANQETIRALNQQLVTEAQTGYGTRSQSIMERLAEYQEKQEELQAKLFRGKQGSGSSGKVLTKVSGKTSKDAFKVLSEVLNSFLPITENLLKFIIFGTTILMLYLGLILTSWDIEDTGGQQGGKNKRKNRANEEDKESMDGMREELRVMANRKKGNSQRSSYKTSLESLPGSSPQKVLVPEVLEEVSQEVSQKVFSKPPGQEVKKFPKPDSEWERFIRASIRESGNVNSPKRVHMLTGIPIDRCLEYRRMLDDIKVDGTPIIETGQGWSRANFGKDVILERVREKEVM